MFNSDSVSIPASTAAIAWILTVVADSIALRLARAIAIELGASHTMASPSATSGATRVEINAGNPAKGPLKATVGKSCGQEGAQRAGREIPFAPVIPSRMAM